MDKRILAAIIVVVLLIIIAIPISAYNGFVGLDLEVQGKFSELQSQYQRQADLIPNLVAVVGSFAGFEAGLLQNVTAMRSAWTQAQTPYDIDKAGTEMTSSLSRLIAVAENYPDIKSSEQYTGLRDELSGTQNRITTARGRWIEAIQAYNTAVRMFPGNVFAGMFGFGAKEFFQVTPETFTTPSVGTQTLP